MASLQISPTPVVILVDKGETTGDAQVTYEADEFVPNLWERRLGVRWKRRVVETYAGNFTVSLRAGEVYQLLMYNREDSDPNVGFDDPVAPVAQLATAGIAKRTPALLSEEEEFGPGGTYFSWFPSHPTIRTCAIMEIGKTEPEITEEGVFFFAEPLGSLVANFKTNHSLELASVQILPGTRYWATLLLLGEDETWQSKMLEFTTLQRTVEILLREIRIINDGSPGHNRASFRLWVCEGDTFRSACALSEREISDRPDLGEEYMEHLALSADCQIPIRFGPSAVTRELQPVTVLTRGIAKSTLGTDDISGNFRPSNEFPANPPLLADIDGDAFLYLPIGSREAVEEGEFSTRAVPLNNGGDNEFEYEVNGLYSVTYE